MAGHHFIDLCHEHDLPAELSSYTGEVAFKTAHSISYFRAHISKDTAGSWIILTDISEDIMLFTELHQRETELDAVFNTIEEHVFLIDPDGIIRNANRAARDYYRVDEAKGLDLISLIRDKSDPDAADPIRRCLGSFEPTFAEQNIIKQRRTVHVHVYPIFDRRGRLRQMLFLERDMTNERLMELEIRVQHRKLQSNLKRLRELDKAKSEWINSISHELRTPLTSIRSYSEILLTYDDTDAETREEFLHIIVQESERLTRLINDLLDMARIESGRMKWDIQVHTINDIITDVVRSLRSIADHGEVVLEIIAPDDSVQIETDRDRLQQVLVNLVSNAIKFSPKGGRVAICMQQEDQEVSVTVEDEGPGIPPARRQAVFERFTQVTDVERGKPAGSGLGLTISKQLIENLEGRISCVSPQVLEGACFIVHHPIRQTTQLTDSETA